MKLIQTIALFILFISIPLLSKEKTDINNSIHTAKKDNIEKEQKFELTTLKGETLHIKTTPNGLHIKELKGKVIFLSFFGYNCPPCKKEIPEFIKMHEKYGNDLEIVAIEVRGLGESYLKKFIQEKKINYSVVPFNKETQKFAYHTAQKANWQGTIPFIIVLDRDGEVQFLQTGLVPYKILEIALHKVK